MKNFPSVYEYMRIYNKSTAIEGVKAVKDGCVYINTQYVHNTVFDTQYTQYTAQYFNC